MPGAGRNRLACAGASLVFLGAPGQAAAQEAADVIVVTGEKIERSLQDTPASVAVTTREMIEDRNIIDLRDIYMRTPNVAGGENTGNFSIRGVDAFDVSGAGSSFLASVYVDGAVLPRRAVTNGPLDIWDVAQVEILRGPQSTLQGRNALAGAVVVRTTDPTYEWDAAARVRIAQYDRQEYAVAVGGPIVSDELAFRLSGSLSEFGGYNDNPYLNSDVDFRDRKTVRGKLLWEPSALPGFRALLSVTHDDFYYGTDLVSAASTYGDRELAFDTETWESSVTTIGTLELEYDLGERWSLASITSYNKSDYEYQYDGDYTVEPASLVYDVEDQDTITQELQARFAYDRFSGLVGAYYYHRDETEYYGGERQLTLEALGVPQLLAAPPFSLPDPLIQQVLAIYAPANPVLLDTFTNDPAKVTNYALFGDMRFEVTDRLTLHLGARYDREEQKNDFSSRISVVNAALLPNPADYAALAPLDQIVAGLNAQLFALADGASGAAPPSSSEFDAFLPKAGVTWRWTDAISTSFIAQKAYRSGGVGANIQRARAFTFDPEYAWNYEFSLRSEWLDGRLTANANLFYLDWTDQQIAVQLSGGQFDTEVANAGSSHLYGFELEATYKPTRNIDLYAGLGHVETEFDEFSYTTGQGVEVDLSGREFADAPNWTASGGVTLRSDIGVFAHLDANYASEANAVVDPNVFGADAKKDARTLVNAVIGYQTEQWALRVYANNLLDEKYIVRPDLNDGLYIYGAPRVVGVRLDLRY